MNVDMVTAALEGRKTVARRVVKPQPAWIDGKGWCWAPPSKKSKLKAFSAHAKDDFVEALATHNPVGFVAGEQRIIREPFYTDQDDAQRIWYAANGPPPETGTWSNLKNGMHMPAWASRAVWHVREARYGRLTDMTEDDILAEGIRVTSFTNGRTHVYGVPSWHRDDWRPTAREAWARFWDGSNQERDRKFQRGPWCQIVTGYAELNA